MTAESLLLEPDSAALEASQAPADIGFDLEAHHSTEVLLATHQVLVARCVIDYAGRGERVESELVIPRRECQGDRPRGSALWRAAQELLAQLLLRRPGLRPTIRIAIGSELVPLATA
ncbi:hypothetical protein [Methylibium sp. Root1272]|uniref:hypothetical protein n=1 Tax=Methylibium sp. Root1272 TaxID=1736441 RepID=UPI0006F50B91|nr:hypothetical protein [Methylibium sp. Root1272]KQW76627.1 hypothetical protein ASC67_02975 [Methylibium sp. Root1272]